MITTTRQTAFAYVSFGIGSILGYHMLLAVMVTGDLDATAFWLGLLMMSCIIFLALHLQLHPRIKPQSPKPTFTVAQSPIHYMTFSSLHSYPYGQYVYVIQDVDVTGMFKIGRTSHPETRIHNFGVHLPFNIGIVYIIPTDDMNKLERTLHRKFRHKRVRGEWFALSALDLIDIESIGQNQNDD